MKYSLVIGRFQPLHDGHVTLIKQLFSEGKKVCIALRDTPIDENNPYTVQERHEMFENAFGNMKGIDGILKIMVIPDIDDVVHGRGVGYGIRRMRLDKKTEEISATKIRKEIPDQCTCECNKPGIPKCAVCKDCKH